MFDTKILDNSDRSIELAAELLKSGEVVGIPTETVYGLGADALNEDAVKKIFEAKDRPADNPLIVHISEFSQIEELVTEIPRLAINCAEKFWPGPLTMIMPKSDRVPMITSGGLDTVGIRMPSNETARKIISACGFPIAAPSANLSGSPSPTSAQHVYNDMQNRIPAIVDAGHCGIGVESTVICFEGRDSIRLLRPGFISVDDLKEITENVIVDKGVTEIVAADAKVASPGMKYKHYAPKAEITILEGTLDAYREYVKENSDNDTTLLVFDKNDADGLGLPYVVYGSTDEEQARNLFGSLRELDRLNAVKVFARCPSKNGVGLAVYNRLIRAAAFRVIRL